MKMNMIQEEIGLMCVLLDHQIKELRDREDDKNQLSQFTQLG